MTSAKPSKPRIIAFYLPQFHPIPENDSWWGKGFTEWTNVGKAKPLYKGHYQPHVPADLGYYDLRVPETREAQADLAYEYGIEGFCYWHYWFGNGRRLLERPFAEVLQSGKPDFPFCLGWANHSWKNKSWIADGKDKLLIEQKYLGDTDFVDHFNALLPAFLDNRYIKIDGKPLFLIWDANGLPDSIHFISLWQKMAADNGLPGIHFITMASDWTELPMFLSKGFNSVAFDCMTKAFKVDYVVAYYLHKILRKIIVSPQILTYKQYIKSFLKWFRLDDHVYPIVVSNWDHSPRSGKLTSEIIVGSTPTMFRCLLIMLFKLLSSKRHECNIVFIRSWNEWAEGNHLEPDLKYGKGHLEALKHALATIPSEKQ